MGLHFDKENYLTAHGYYDTDWSTMDQPDYYDEKQAKIERMRLSREENAARIRGNIDKGKTNITADTDTTIAMKTGANALMDIWNSANDILPDFLIEDDTLDIENRFNAKVGTGEFDENGKEYVREVGMNNKSFINHYDPIRGLYGESMDTTLEESKVNLQNSVDWLSQKEEDPTARETFYGARRLVGYDADNNDTPIYEYKYGSSTDGYAVRYKDDPKERNEGWELIFEKRFYGAKKFEEVFNSLKAVQNSRAHNSKSENRTLTHGYTEISNMNILEGIEKDFYGTDNVYVDETGTTQIKSHTLKAIQDESDRQLTEYLKYDKAEYREGRFANFIDGVQSSVVSTAFKTIDGLLDMLPGEDNTWFNDLSNKEVTDKMFGYDSRITANSQEKARHQLRNGDYAGLVTNILGNIDVYLADSSGEIAALLVPGMAVGKLAKVSSRVKGLEAKAKLEIDKIPDARGSATYITKKKDIENRTAQDINKYMRSVHLKTAVGTRALLAIGRTNDQYDQFLENNNGEEPDNLYSRLALSFAGNMAVLSLESMIVGAVGRAALKGKSGVGGFLGGMGLEAVQEVADVAQEGMATELGSAKYADEGVLDHMGRKLENYDYQLAAATGGLMSGGLQAGGMAVGGVTNIANDKLGTVDKNQEVFMTDKQHKDLLYKDVEFFNPEGKTEAAIDAQSKALIRTVENVISSPFWGVKNLDRVNVLEAKQDRTAEEQAELESLSGDSTFQQAIGKLSDVVQLKRSNYPDLQTMKKYLLDDTVDKISYMKGFHNNDSLKQVLKTQILRDIIKNRINYFMENEIDGSEDLDTKDGVANYVAQFIPQVSTIMDDIEGSTALEKEERDKLNNELVGIITDHVLKKTPSVGKMINDYIQITATKGSYANLKGTNTPGVDILKYLGSDGTFNTDNLSEAEKEILKAFQLNVKSTQESLNKAVEDSMGIYIKDETKYDDVSEHIAKTGYLNPFSVMGPRKSMTQHAKAIAHSVVLGNSIPAEDTNMQALATFIESRNVNTKLRRDLFDDKKDITEARRGLNGLNIIASDNDVMLKELVDLVGVLEASNKQKSNRIEEYIVHIQDKITELYGIQNDYKAVYDDVTEKIAKRGDFEDFYKGSNFNRKLNNVEDLRKYEPFAKSAKEKMEEAKERIKNKQTMQDDIYEQQLQASEPYYQTGPEHNIPEEFANMYSVGSTDNQTPPPSAINEENPFYQDDKPTVQASEQSDSDIDLITMGFGDIASEYTTPEELARMHLVGSTDNQTPPSSLNIDEENPFYSDEKPTRPTSNNNSNSGNDNTIQTVMNELFEQFTGREVNGTVPSTEHMKEFVNAVVDKVSVQKNSKGIYTFERILTQLAKAKAGILTKDIYEGLKNKGTMKEKRQYLLGEIFVNEELQNRLNTVDMNELGITDSSTIKHLNAKNQDNYSLLDTIIELFTSLLKRVYTSNTIAEDKVLDVLIRGLAVDPRVHTYRDRPVKQDNTDNKDNTSNDDIEGNNNSTKSSNSSDTKNNDSGNTTDSNINDNDTEDTDIVDQDTKDKDSDRNTEQDIDSSTKQEDTKQDQQDDIQNDTEVVQQDDTTQQQNDTDIERQSGTTQEQPGDIDVNTDTTEKEQTKATLRSILGIMSGKVDVSDLIDQLEKC
jgi:hypothetical protein